MSRKFFPIQTETACPLKWSWSTLLLDSEKTASCHRTAFSKITTENFNNFHNTDLKISDRQRMLAGQWPESSCAYCRQIEEAGGFSDRQRHLSIPGVYPEELDQRISTSVAPSILEVYFENTCNLACVYCRPEFSSRINAEYAKHKSFVNGGVSLVPIQQLAPSRLITKFWEWLTQNIHQLKRLHILGGEPLVQSHIQDIVNFLDANPAPNLELNIITNLVVPYAKLDAFAKSIKKLLSARKIKRLDITASIDCLGDAQEYVRYGLNLDEWKENFQYLVDRPWIKLNVNQTISVLTIKTMPEFIDLISSWKRVRPIGHYFSGVSPNPLYLQPTILGPEVFNSDFESILSKMPRVADEDEIAYNYMKGIHSEILNSKFDSERVRDLFIFLQENDRRRGTDWRTVFPWLVEFENRVV